MNFLELVLFSALLLTYHDRPTENSLPVRILNAKATLVKEAEMVSGIVKVFIIVNIDIDDFLALADVAFRGGDKFSPERIFSKFIGRGIVDFHKPNMALDIGTPLVESNLFKKFCD